MFKWVHEYSIDVNMPIHNVWILFVGLDWPNWDERFESFHCEEEIKKGSIIKAKLKNTNIFLSILVTEMKLYKEYNLKVKSLLMNQDSFFTFKEISPDKTTVNIKTVVCNLLVPFFKSFFLKRINNHLSKMEIFLKEKTNDLQSLDMHNQHNECKS